MCVNVVYVLRVCASSFLSFFPVTHRHTISQPLYQAATRHVCCSNEPACNTQEPDGVHTRRADPPLANHCSAVPRGPEIRGQRNLRAPGGAVTLAVDRFDVVGRAQLRAHNFGTWVDMRVYLQPQHCLDEFELPIHQ